MNHFSPVPNPPIARLKLDVVDLRTHLEASAGGHACNCPCLCSSDEE